LKSLLGREKEVALDWGTGNPGLLCTSGRALHGNPHLIEGLEDVEARSTDRLGERFGVGANRARPSPSFVR
jgi:hypothetical protein